MKSKILTLVAAATLLSVSACSYVPDSADIVEEQLVAVTQYDVNADFGDYATFYVPDKVYYITSFNSKTGPAGSYVSAPAVVDAVKKNMTDRGYTFSSSSVTADLNIQLAALKVTNVNVSYPGWWWDPYYPYYPYDPYYPYYPYPYTPVVSAYATGALVMDITDQTALGAKKPVVWTGLVRAILDGTHIPDDVVVAINECFAQTPDFNTTAN